MAHGRDVGPGMALGAGAGRRQIGGQLCLLQAFFSLLLRGTRPKVAGTQNHGACPFRALALVMGDELQPATLSFP